MHTRRTLITGGAGFIGANLAHRLLVSGNEVIVYDNMSRRGARGRVAWLTSNHGLGRLRVVPADVNDVDTLKRSAEGADVVFHLAGQVAVTCSVSDPRADFTDNAMGTFNTLEAARAAGNDPIFVYASTNKVYGRLPDLEVVEDATRYRCPSLPFGIPETQRLDFHSPYGCSKGAGDQYVHDYARIYGLRSVVLRQSCVHGALQFGAEDQGWVSWLIIAALLDRPVRVYGDGKQVRDLLFIDDLVDAYQAVVDNIGVAAGKVYNIGGGPDNALSIWAEFGPLVEELAGHRIPVTYRPWRPGDQPVYVSDIRLAGRDLCWQPRVSAREGVVRTFNWIKAHLSAFEAA